MSKSLLHLSIETEVLNYAKASGINLSEAFETYVRSLMQINNPLEPNKDYQKEYDSKLAEIEILKTKIEQQESKQQQLFQQQNKLKELELWLNNRAESIKKYNDLNWSKDAQIFVNLQRILREKYGSTLTANEIQAEIKKRLMNIGYTYG